MKKSVINQARDIKKNFELKYTDSVIIDNHKMCKFIALSQDKKSLLFMNMFSINDNVYDYEFIDLELNNITDLFDTDYLNKKIKGGK